MVEAILNRVSTRTFTNESLNRNDIERIIEVVKDYEEVEGPFKNKFKFTFNLNDKTKTNGKKIGTYGMLKNVPAFIGGVCKNEKQSIVDFGYMFQNIILELTGLGYGTCWLGGTFKRKDYRSELKDNEIIPAISPVGFRAEKRSLVDRTLRSAAQSNNRIAFEKLFFNYDSLVPLKENSKSIFNSSLKLVRRGPSASNKQPWRIYVENKTAHVYLERTKGYAKPLRYDIQALDAGIALSHLEVGLKPEGLTYEFYEEKQPKEILNNEYIISVKVK